MILFSLVWVYISSVQPDSNYYTIMPPVVISQPHSLLHFLWNYFCSQTITECLEIIFGAIVIESTDLILVFISLALSVVFDTALCLPWKTPLLSATATNWACPKIQSLVICFSLYILAFLRWLRTTQLPLWAAKSKISGSRPEVSFHLYSSTCN